MSDLFANWSTGGDALSGFVQIAGLEGVVLSALDLGSPWRVGSTDGAEPVLHFVRTGKAFLELAGHSTVEELVAGDVVMLPRGGKYTLSDTFPSAVPEPILLRTPKEQTMCSVRLGGNGTPCQIICCAYRFRESTVSAPLLSFLPKIIRLSRGPAAGGVRSTLEALIEELRERQLGRDGIVSRLAELAYLRVLRAHITENGATEEGVLGALTDPQIGRALQSMHQELAAPWTVGQLASNVGMSRAAFAELFARKVGVSPMRYLQQCRIQEAAKMVAATSLAFSEIGRRVGYSDATAFSRAFRRETGRSAREYRQSLVGGEPCKASSAG